MQQVALYLATEASNW